MTLLDRQLRVTAAAAAVALVAVMTACAPGEEPAGEASEPTITLAIQAAPPSLDPAQLDEGQGTFVWSSVFDTLLKVDTDGSIQPNAATDWEYSEDLLTLTLTLRDDLTFSNGDPITAEIAAGSLERTRTTPGPQQPKLASVEEISAPDDRTITLTLSRPDPTLVNYLAQATGVVADASTFDDPAAALRPLGSGPYVLAESTADGSSYVLERREDYWNVDAYPFETVTVRVIQDPTAIVNALLAGEVTAANIQAAQREQVEGAGLGITEISSAGTMLLLLADRGGAVQPALADERVRKAINLAFDRELYVSSLLAGVAEPTEQSFNVNGAAYDPALEGTYAYDPEAARELLAEAGYQDGFTLRMPSTVISTTFEPAVTQSLADIGITVEWVPVPPQNIAGSLTSAEFAAVLWMEGTNLAGREMANYFSPTGFLNPFHWQTAEFDEMLAAIAQERDPEAQAALYKEATAYTVDHALNAPIASLGALWATAEGTELAVEINVPKTVRMFAPTSD